MATAPSSAAQSLHPVLSVARFPEMLDPDRFRPHAFVEKGNRANLKAYALCFVVHSELLSVKYHAATKGSSLELRVW